MSAKVGQRTQRRTVWTVVLVVSLIVLVAALIGLGVSWYSYFQGRQKYDDVEKLAALERIDDAVDAALEDVGAVTVDWDALVAANSDTVGWVYVPETAISYPIVQGQDNYFYLTHDFDGDAGWLANYGAIFLDCENAPDWSDASYFVYGHHMNDGSMFADLVNYADQDFFDAHRTVYVLSPRGNFKLRGFAVVHCSPDEEIVRHAFDDDAQRTAYIKDKINRSEVKAPDAPSAAEIKKTFAFATCDNESWGRYILYCYVEQANAAGLHGSVGIDGDAGQATGFSQDIRPDR